MSRTATIITESPTFTLHLSNAKRDFEEAVTDVNKSFQEESAKMQRY